MTHPVAPPPTDLAAPWACEGIGAVRQVRSPAEPHLPTEPGTLTLAVSGGSVSGTADAAGFLFQPVAGDLDLMTRVAIDTDSGVEARAGLMLRESLAPDSPHVTVFVRASTGLQLVDRAVAGGGSTTAELPSGASDARHPGWLRLLRTGQTVSVYASADGTAWDLLATRTVPTFGTVVAGLAACSPWPATVSFGRTTLVALAGRRPTAVISGPTTAVTGQPVVLSGVRSHDADDIVVDHAWHTSDGQTATGPTPSFVFARPGTYTVTLTASDDDGNTATASAEVAVTEQLPAGWLAQTVGSASSGYTAYRYDSDTFTLSATSGAITACSDGFEFAYRELSGDGELVARVVLAQRPHRDVDAPSPTWASLLAVDPDFRAAFVETERVWSDEESPTGAGASLAGEEALSGLMMRESLEADAPHVSLLARRIQPPQLLSRRIAGGATTVTELAGAGGLPRWLRLSRTGRVVRGATSKDGVTWELQGTVTVDPALTLYVGLVTSPQQSRFSRESLTATFDRVRLVRPSAAPSVVIAGPGGEGGGAPPVTTVFSGATRALALHLGRTGQVLTFSAEESSHSDRTLTRHVWRTSDGRRAAGPSASFAFDEPGTHTVTLTVTDDEGNVGSAQATVWVTADLPAPWQTEPVGRASPKGSARHRASADAFTVATAGVPVHPSGGPTFPPAADALQVLWQPVRGDVDLVTRVESIRPGSAADACGGLTIRQSLNADAPHVSLRVRRSGPPEVVTRLVEGGASAVTYLSGPDGLPRWLRLVRSGHTFSAYTSADGVTWQLRASRTVAMTGTVHAGLTVASTLPAAAEFTATSVTTGGNHARAWTRGVGEHTG
jgi:regulation of enolase protein 1 (concanavalin A-like superfamily)/chitodextrinase